MENFIVSARKYRPAAFDTVVGQAHITNTLKNAIRNNQLAQAFLFCGPRGVGKTTCARILAKTINCLNITADAEACNTCESCLSFNRGASLNVHELDAASNNSVDDIRNLVEQVRYAPQAGKYKTYIIDEVHMLSQSAFNAFLKTLEEPPPYAIFILATTEKHKIIPTILSRCQIFDFNRIRVDDIASHLASIAEKESINADPDALHIIAQKADGALRDALSIFDQVVNFSGNELSYKAVIDNLNILDYDYYFRFTDHFLSEDVASSLLLFDEVLAKGFDGNHFINGLGAHFRNLLVCKDASTLRLLEASEGVKQRYQSQAASASPSFLLSALNIMNTCDIQYKASKNQRLHVELALMKLCHLEAAINLAKANPLPEEDKKKTDPPIISNGKALPEVKETDLTPTAQPVVQPAKSIEIARKSNSEQSLKSSVRVPKLSELSSSSLERNEPGALSTLIEQAMPATDFTESQLHELWNTYARQMMDEGKMHFHTLLSNRKPMLVQEHQIFLSLDHKVEQDLLNDAKTELLTFLRSSLNNYSIDLKTEINIVEDTKPKLYTAKDKFRFMAQKNPQLLELKNRLDLEIDY